MVDACILLSMKRKLELKLPCDDNNQNYRCFDHCLHICTGQHAEKKITTTKPVQANNKTRFKQRETVKKEVMEKTKY